MLKIELPEIKEDQQQARGRKRSMISDDLSKGGHLAHTLVFCYLCQPISVTELTKEINTYYHQDYDRATVYRNLKKLNDMGIIFTTTTGIITSIKPSERKEIYNEILTKYYKFLDGVPDQFRKRFQDINYFWVGNGENEEYVEWACKLLGLKFKKENGKSN